MSKVKPTPGQKLTLQKVYAYMLAHNIPRQMIAAIRETLIYDAVVESADLRYDRIYTGVAIMLHEEFGFGATRILRGLKKFDEICGSVLDTDENGNEVANWPDLMKRLEDETEIVIHTGEDNRLICEHRRVKQEAKE